MGVANLLSPSPSPRSTMHVADDIMDDLLMDAIDCPEAGVPSVPCDCGQCVWCDPEAYKLAEVSVGELQKVLALDGVGDETSPHGVMIGL